MTENNKTTTLVLSRFFHIFEPLTLFRFIFSVVGIILVTYFDITLDVISLAVYLLIIALLVISFLLVFLTCPHKVVIKDDSIDYYSKNGKVSKSFKNIKDIKLGQNPIEKIFNVGHISYSVEIYSAPNMLGKTYTQKHKDTVYGIQNFSDFKKNFV